MRPSLSRPEPSGRHRVGTYQVRILISLLSQHTKSSGEVLGRGRVGGTGRRTPDTWLKQDDGNPNLRFSPEPGPCRQ